MDLNILIWIQNHIVSDALNPIMIFLSNIWGEGFAGILISLLLLIKKSTRKTGLIMLISLVLCAVIANFMIKPIFARPRPYTVYDIQILIPEPPGTSFPSGHASSVFSFVWAYFITRKDFWRWIFVGFGILVSFSRLYLFVHYPSDVLVGILIGILFAYLSRWLINYLENRSHWLGNFLS